MSSFHKTNFGMFTTGFRCDMDGYVHLTIASVMSGNYDTAGERMTRDLAREIANDNKDALKKNRAALNEWNRSNS